MILISEELRARVVRHLQQSNTGPFSADERFLLIKQLLEAQPMREPEPRPLRTTASPDC